MGASRAGEAESTLCPEIPHALWAAPVPKISPPSGHGVLRALEWGGEEALPLDDTGVDIWTSAATLWPKVTLQGPRQAAASTTDPLEQTPSVSAEG